MPDPPNQTDGTRDPRVPILAVDIDGVISLFEPGGEGFGRPRVAGLDRQASGEYHLIGGALHRISTPVGDRLRRVGAIYELVWASGWGELANEALPQILGLPELPCLRFEDQAVFGTANWKLDALEEFAGDRPLAWIDDSFDHDCYEWGDRRRAPTLLVPTDSAIGMEEAQVEALEAWARDGFRPG